MNKKLLISIAAIGVLLIIIWYFFGSSTVDSAVSFSDVEVKPDSEAIAYLAKGYITLPSITANEDAIINLVGAIALRTRKGDGDDEWSYILNFRPARDLIQTKIIDEQLFHGIVSVKGDFGGQFKIASANVSGDELAETSIRNQLVVGYKDPSDIPYKELSKMKFSPDKDYFFIASVVVTDITVRRFRKHTGNGKIEGMAFGANGEIYAEKDAIKSQKVISFLPVNPLDLQASEAGGGSEISQLAAKSRREKLSNSEAEILIRKLSKEAKTIAPMSIPLGPPGDRLPDSLRNMKTILWFDDVRPIRQSTENRCWAAATAMLFSWKKNTLISELEAVTSLGPTWETTYKRDKPLPRSYKFDFLSAAKFRYSTPQSYAPSGLISLLKKRGPLWFTIDQNFSRHATILTGIFQDEMNNSYWVSYIDPFDGSLKADTYASFMRRYEAPAYRANEEGISIAMTEEDLDIQVIHW